MQSDIHQYDRRLSLLLDRIKNSNLTDDNKKLLFDFDSAMLLLENLGKPRRIKLLGTMFILATTFLHKDLRKADVEDIKECIRDIESRSYSPWTIADYKIVLRKFFKWLTYGDMTAQTKELPPMLSWIKVHVKKKDQPRVQASDILTEEEAHRLIAAANVSRDRAFIAMLYELGARIGEIGNLTIGQVSRDKYSYLIDLSGKTGHRTPRIVMADPYLTEWIDHHPANNEPTAPLWVSPDHKGGHKKMLYGALRALVLRLKQKAGIKKRLYPHLFRHSRVTHLLSKRFLNEAQAKVYFGWTPDSKMLSEYAHLVSQDVNETILEIHGIKPEKETHRQTTKTCPRCARVNAQEARFCIHCSSLLDPQAAFRQDQERDQQDQALNIILKDEQVQELIMRKLLNLDAATLKRLATKEATTPGLQTI